MTRFLRDAKHDIHPEMMAITRDIVAKTLFDADVSDEARVIGDASHFLTEYFGKRLGSLLQLVPPWVPTPANLRLRRAVRGLDEVVYRMIAAPYSWNPRRPSLDPPASSRCQ